MMINNTLTIAKVLLRQDSVVNDFHNLIGMGLDYNDVDFYDVTLSLRRAFSFGQEYNRFSDISGLYPFMVMAA
jgi:hypothetical protein